MREDNYDVIASFEKDNWWYCAKRDLWDKILFATGRNFKHALDLGCGVGSNFEILNKYSNRVSGIDFSQKAINYCATKPYSFLKKMDATRMSFKSESFDLIICSDVLEHLDDKKAISEISRVLRPGGLLLFSVPAHDYLWGPTDIISKHVKRYEKRDFSPLLEQFRIRRLSYWNSLMFLPNLAFIALSKLLKNSREGRNTLELIPSFLNKLIFVLLKIENSFFIRFNNPQGVSIVGIAEKK